MPPPLLLGALALAALALAAMAAGIVLITGSGARASLGRRLAGPRELHVGDLLDGRRAPERPVRVVGRVRCPNPIVTAQQDRLVALHRDVEVAAPDGRWRTIERVRETRGFELWDHAGSVQLDAADAAEPLITIPYVWQGAASDLDQTYRPALDRVTAETGGPPGAARAVTRTISVVDRLLVLGLVEDRGTGVRLRPPSGGYLISTLDLDDAMRLLGGPGRGRYVAGTAIAAVGVVLGLAALALALISLLGA